MKKYSFINLICALGTIFLSCQSKPDLREDLWQVTGAEFITENNGNLIRATLDVPDPGYWSTFAFDIEGTSMIGSFSRWVGVSGHSNDSLDCIYYRGTFDISGKYGKVIDYDSGMTLTFDTSRYFYRFEQSGDLISGYTYNLVSRCRITTPSCFVIKK